MKEKNRKEREKIRESMSRSRQSGNASSSLVSKAFFIGRGNLSAKYRLRDRIFSIKYRQVTRQAFFKDEFGQ